MRLFGLMATALSSLFAGQGMDPYAPRKPREPAWPEVRSDKERTNLGDKPKPRKGKPVKLETWAEHRARVILNPSLAPPKLQSFHRKPRLLFRP